MEFNRITVLNALQAVNPGLAKRATVEEAQTFIFSNGYVTTYNDNICVKYPLDLGITASVTANKFFSVIQNMSSKAGNEDVIELFMKENLLIVKNESSEITINTTPVERFEKFLSKIKTENLTEWKDIPKDFLEGLNLCSFSAGTDRSLEYVTCINVLENCMYSTDNLRASKFQMEDDLGEFLLPVSSVNQLLKYNLEKYIITNKWIHFLTGENAVFSCRLSLAEKVDLKGFFNSIENPNKEINLPDELKQAVQFVSIFAEGEIALDLKINIKIENNEIVLQSKRDDGTSRKTIPIKYNGTCIEFSVNPNFLDQVLTYATKIQIINGEKAMFKQGKFTHIFALHVL